MARGVTVQQIVDQVQILTQDPDHALATEAQYVGFINDEHARLYSYYVAAEPDRYRTEATISGLANTSAYALPADWLATVAIDFTSGTLREPLSRLQEQDRNRFIFNSGQSRAYRVIGTNVVLYPTPLAGQTYTHVYIPTAPELTSVGTTIDCRLGHEKYLQMCVAKMLLNSENQYDGRWDPEIEQITAELKMEANYRYFHDVARIQSENTLRSRFWPYNWPFGVRW